MGFHLRKSFNLGGIRFNLSNSGIGLSTGIKGLRFGIDGKGRSYIGGGKGILRYRKYVNSAKTGKRIEINSNDYPTEFDKIPSWLAVLFLFIYPPISLIFLVFAVAFWTIEGGNILKIIFSLIFAWGAIFPYFAIFGNTKKNKVHQALIALKDDDYKLALELLEEVNKKYQKKLSYNGKTFINDKIYSCYEKLEDWESALKFLEDNIIMTNNYGKRVICYNKLGKWKELIHFIQNYYDEKDKSEHPAIYAMLSDSFMKLGQNDVALETLLTGPINKRSMDLEMCAFRYQLGKCYEANNDIKNAIKQYTKVYSYDTNFEDVEEKLNNLRKEN